MKISYNWLQSYFNKKLPKPDQLAEVLTMHSFEVESVSEIRFRASKSDFVLDIDVLPNRAHDCLSHYGIAKELSALLKLKVESRKWKLADRKKLPSTLHSQLSIDVKEPKLCRRYTGRIIEGIKVKESPKWLKERLETINQKSINNIVDAANYVMFEFGQPLHAFDADKVEGSIIVRKTKKGEEIETLDGEKYKLDKDTLVIADSKNPLAIAGIKGGKKAEIDNNTKNIILESANFEPINIRKTSIKLGLRTESSLRFENEISPELAGKAMDRLTELVLEVAGGKIGSKADFYSQKSNLYKIGLHPKDVSKLLGVDISEKEIINILKRLGFEIKKINHLKNVLKLAKSLQGKSYKYGASVSFDAPDYFDCSSFVAYVFAYSGIQIPRMTVDQYFFGEPVEKKGIKPGDLVFSNTKSGKVHYESKEFAKGMKIKEGIDHCGIYLGKGKVIHSSRYNRNSIVIEDLKKSRQFKDIIGFKRIITEDNDLLIVTVPFERLDIRRKEDLIEEVARIYGYEKIPSELPVGTLIPAKRNDNNFYAEIVRNILAGAGFSEVYNYSFGNEGQIKILNPISKDKQYLRTNLFDGLKKNVIDNSRYFKNIRIFEIGKIFPSRGETISLAGIINNDGFYEAKGVVEMLLKKIGITDAWFNDHPEKTSGIMIGNTSIGMIDHNGWEINFEILVRMAKEESEYRPISRYPAVNRDISIFVSFKTKVIEVMDIIENTAGELLIDTDLFDIYPEPSRHGGSYEAGEQEDRKSFAFRLVFQSHKKTLDEKEINTLMNKIMDALDANLDWEVRR